MRVGGCEGVHVRVGACGDVEGVCMWGCGG